MELHHSHSERPGWVSALRAGALLMVVGVPLVIAHLVVLLATAHGELSLLNVLTSIATQDGIDRLYVAGLAFAVSGTCIVVGAVLEGWLGRIFPMK